MKQSKFYIFTALLLASMFIAVPLALGGVSMTVTSSLAGEPYNRFLVADLGILGGGRQNEVFTVEFGTDATTDNYYLHIKVVSVSDGATLLDGNTDSLPYDENYSGKVFNNSNITDSGSLGGSFTISDTSQNLQDRILATGALPQGSFTIDLDFYKSATETADAVLITTQSIAVQIIPPFLQPSYPVDTTVPGQGLTFSWGTNVKDLTFHLFGDPAGNQELYHVQLGTGVRSVPATGFDHILRKWQGRDLYWQVKGLIKTSHGNEAFAGPLSYFIYYEDSVVSQDIGLSFEERRELEDKVIELLGQIVNKRAANSIKQYDLDRVVLDRGVVARGEVIPILDEIIAKEVKVNAIYFR